MGAVGRDAGASARASTCWPTPTPTDTSRIAGLAPGNYDLRVTAPSFLPTVREDIALAAGATKVVNITLNTLFEAARMMPSRKRDNDDDDSWKWTLRSTANRPILRFDDGIPVVVEAASRTGR